MTVRLAQRNRPGVKTYYVSSRSKPGVEHTVVHVRRAGMNRWSCTCGKFVHRLQSKRTHRHCHHIKEVRFGQFENLKTIEVSASDVRAFGRSPDAFYRRRILEFKPSLETLLSASIAAVESRKKQA